MNNLRQDKRAAISSKGANQLHFHLSEQKQPTVAYNEFIRAIETHVVHANIHSTTCFLVQKARYFDATSARDSAKKHHTRTQITQKRKHDEHLLHPFVERYCLIHFSVTPVSIRSSIISTSRPAGSAPKQLQSFVSKGYTSYSRTDAHILFHFDATRGRGSPTYTYSHRPHRYRYIHPQAHTPPPPPHTHTHTHRL